jgi:hypothetical protein
MRILLHLGGIAFFCGLYFLGKLMIGHREGWAEALKNFPVSNGHLCKLFLYSGRTFEGFALVCGFLEVVAVMILSCGWIIDMLVAMAL